MEHRPEPTRYEIHLRGFLSDGLLSAFPELHARRRNHETVLIGALPDQAALHGVIARIESLGLELLEVRRPRSGRGTRAAADRPTEETGAGSAASDGDMSSARVGA